METSDVGIGTNGSENVPDSGDFYAPGDARIPKVLGKKKKKKIPTFKRWLKESNDYDIEYWMEGNCAILALELNKLLGWGITIFSNPDGEGWDEEDIEYTHVAVEHPKYNLFLDAGGLRKKEEIENYFGSNYLSEYEISSEVLQKIINDEYGPFDTTASTKEAEKKAKELIQKNVE